MSIQKSREIRPVIGIPCLRMLQPSGVYRHAISSSYIEAVIAADAAPLLMPASADEAALYSVYRMLDGLLLSGGDDVNPALYNEEMNGTEEIDDLRDTTEMLITRWAIEDGMPLLGICRGQQVLNVALGGSLYQDIPSQLPESPLNHRESAERQQRDYIAHPVKLNPDSRMAAILGADSFVANTLHHQSVKEAGQGLKVVGIAPDGVVEALEGSDPTKWVFAVQCHPEDLWRKQEWAGKLFRAFVAETRQYRSKAQ